MPDENNARNLWQAQEVEKFTLTLDEVRLRATRFEQRIHRRNLREYAAAALVIALFASQLWRNRGWHAAPAALMTAGTIYVMFQLHRRASARPLPADVGLRGSAEFLRMELERQRDAIKTVWKWYLLPFLPGLTAGLVLAGIDHGINAQWNKMAAFFVVVFMGIWALNQRGARRLDRKIQELRAMETDPE